MAPIIMTATRSILPGRIMVQTGLISAILPYKR
jgi:hypothetical protein